MHKCLLFSTALSTLVTYYLFELVFLFSSDSYPGVEFLDNITVLFLIFWKTFVLFSTVAVPIYISTNSAGWFPFVYILSSTCYFLFVCLFYDIHSDRYKVISHCGFDLFMYLLAICMSSLEKKCYAGLLQVFIFFLDIQFHEFFMYFGC